jgi:hypothetical protein
MTRPIILSTLLLAAASVHATPVHLPGGAPVSADPQSRCGYVSSQWRRPVEQRDYYGVDITRIDGESTPLQPQNRHRVDPGVRTLTVSDFAMSPHHLTVSASTIAQIDKMKRLEQQRAYKTFEVDVKPGVSYRIGARLRRDRLDGESIRANEYWEPVVWEERAEPCR